MTTIKDFSQWYNNNVDPTLEAMQKMVLFYHQNEIDRLKLGFPNLANFTQFAKVIEICARNLERT